MSVRHEWYQSDKFVVVTVLLKNAVDKNYSVKIDPDRLEVSADNYSLVLNLFKNICVEKSSYKATASKIEINLAKIDGERWEVLEKKTVAAAQPEPSSTKKKPDWDKLSKEIEKKEAEEQKGEEALQELFQKIYGESNEDVRKAMNKSFIESGGTVLSTNWSEVSAKKVEVKPPDGMEFKKWDN